MKITEQEILRRRDMRDVLTFTIDPEDAKDFDDALSFYDPEDGTYQVGVHIADVSYYVKSGDPIDLDAYAKGTSTYLVDQVLPMLPEELCNDLCSLRENEEKLCMSVIFTLTHDARVIKYKVCRTVIRSDKRLTYEQVAPLLLPPSGECPDATGIPGVTPELVKALRELNVMAKILRQQRLANGALDLEQEEVRFRLDENKHPVEIYFKHMTDANHLIEEFMLLANRYVATHMKDHLMVYRVHDIPDEEKMRQLKNFKKRMGSRVQDSVIETLTVRAMAKAEYSTRNIGHYGLQFRYYTHFTSPIRRYPDLMVHRLVEKYIFGKNTHGAILPFTPTLQAAELEEACQHCSEMELAAQQAERDSIKEMQAIWMNDHIDEEFDAHICNVTDFGFFVQLDDSRCEGLVHVSTLPRGEYWMLDEKNYRLVGEQSNRTFTMGDAVRVRVTRADAEKRQIDFVLV